MAANGSRKLGGSTMVNVYWKGKNGNITVSSKIQIQHQHTSCQIWHTKFPWVENNRRKWRLSWFRFQLCLGQLSKANVWNSHRDKSIPNVVDSFAIWFITWISIHKCPPHPFPWTCFPPRCKLCCSIETRGARTKQPDPGQGNNIQYWIWWIWSQSRLKNTNNLHLMKHVWKSAMPTGEHVSGASIGYFEGPMLHWQ